MQIGKITSIYLIRPEIRDHDYFHGEKPVVTTYIARNETEKEELEATLKIRGFRSIKIDKLRGPLPYVPPLYRHVLAEIKRLR